MSNGWNQDAKLAVDLPHAKAVCKIGKGKLTCRYLTMSAKGWSCEKLNPEGRGMIDRRVARGQFVAKSINCSGRLSR